MRVKYVVCYSGRLHNHKNIPTYSRLVCLYTTTNQILVCRNLHQIGACCRVSRSPCAVQCAVIPQDNPLDIRRDIGLLCEFIPKIDLKVIPAKLRANLFKIHIQCTIPPLSGRVAYSDRERGKRNVICGGKCRGCGERVRAIEHRPGRLGKANVCCRSSVGYDSGRDSGGRDFTSIHPAVCQCELVSVANHYCRQCQHKCCRAFGVGCGLCRANADTIHVQHEDVQQSV